MAMKGQIAIVLLILFLLSGIIAFLILSFFVLPALKTVVTTPTLEPQVTAIITALIGPLPEQCSVLTTTECRFCMIKEKITPFVVNTAFGLILFSVIFGAIGGPAIDWSGSGQRVPEGLVKNFGVSLLISIMFSIFMMQQPDPLRFIGPLTLILAITVRLVSFMVIHIAPITRITDFFLAAYILVFGWENWWWIFIIPLGALVWATAVSNGRPNLPLNQGGLLVLVIGSLILGFYVFTIFEYSAWTPLGSLPTKIEFHGLANYITEKAGLPEIACGKNTLGPESTISL